jgi:hypothetical protein
MTTKTGRLSFPFYHRQLEDNYCGPACAQMILDYLGVFETDQASLAGSVNSTGISALEGGVYNSWFTRPDELVTMLHSQALDPDRPFVHWNFPDHSQFRTQLKNFVEDQSIPPPIVPVHGLAGHWVVLFQYHVNGRNRSFIGHDPSFNQKDRGAIPGGPVVINIADQRKNFRHARNLVAIVKSPDVDAREGGQDAPADEMEQTGRGLDPLPSIASEQFPPQNIPRQAMEEMIAYGVIDPESSRGISPDPTPGAPLLVKVLDEPDENYYLIGLQHSSNKNRYLTRLDAYEGQYLDSLSIPPTEYLLGKSAIGSEVYKNVYKQLVTQMKKELWFRAFDMELSRTNPDGVEEPNLIWKLCNESLSPYYPFYEVRAEQTTFYVRIDGVVFTNLTTGRWEENLRPANE